MAYAWPGLISARLAESPAGVCDTTKAFALSGSNVTALASDPPQIGRSIFAGPGGARQTERLEIPLRFGVS